jgi:hypothetical protein
LSNGDLLAAASEAHYDLLVTTDQNLRYQQNLDARDLTVVVLMTTSWPRMQLRIDRIVAAVDQAAPGSYLEVEI